MTYIRTHVLTSAVHSISSVSFITGTYVWPRCVGAQSILITRKLCSTFIHIYTIMYMIGAHVQYHSSTLTQRNTKSTLIGYNESTSNGFSNEGCTYQCSSFHLRCILQYRRICKTRVSWYTQHSHHKETAAHIHQHLKEWVSWVHVWKAKCSTYIHYTHHYTPVQVTPLLVELPLPGHVYGPHNTRATRTQCHIHRRVQGKYNINMVNPNLLCLLLTNKQ